MMKSELSFRRNPNGFTLIELIVSIVVVLILLAILMTSLQKGRESAHAASCRSNLRQLAVAGLAYINDNQGALPDRTAWGYPTSNAYSLGSYLSLPPRSGSALVLRDTTLTCPAIQSSEYRSTIEYHRSYSINQYATGSDNSSGANAGTWFDQVSERGAPLVAANVQDPAKMAFFIDGTGLPDDEGYRYSTFTAPNRLDGRPSGEWHTIYIHQDKVNVAYMDGHIGSIGLDDNETPLIGPTNSSSGSPRTHPFWGASR